METRFDKDCSKTNVRENSNFHNFFMEVQNNPYIHVSKSETPVLEAIHVFSEIMFEVELDKIVIDRHTICVFPKSPQFKLRATTLKLLICLEKR